MGGLHGGGAHYSRPLLQNSRLPQLVTHRRRPAPHTPVKPRCEPPTGRLPLMALGLADQEVGCRFLLRSTQEVVWCGVVWCGVG